MSNSEETLLRLETALEKILIGNPKRIENDRKLTVRSVEEEAGLGNGSAYYYPEFVAKIKSLKTGQKQHDPGGKHKSEKQKLYDIIRNERRIKNKYFSELRRLREQNNLMASQHHQLTDALVHAHNIIKELQVDLVEARRERLVRIDHVTHESKE